MKHRFLFLFLLLASLGAAADDASKTWTDPVVAAAEDADFTLDVLDRALGSVKG